MKIITAKTFTNSIFLAIVLTACTTGPKPAQQVEEVNPLSQQSVNAVLWYNTSAENAYIYEQTYYTAALMTQKNMGLAKESKPFAVVLDIDETVLDNSPYSLNLIKTNTQYTPETWAEWVTKADAKALPGVKNYIEYCEQNAISVFYISNRSAALLNATLKNLESLGLPFADEAHVLLMQDESDKTPRRDLLEREYNVLLYIGDNLLDFDNRYLDRSENFGKTTVQNSLEEMLPRHLLLPNPMYGQWESAFNLEKDLTPAQKAKKKVESATNREF